MVSIAIKVDVTQALRGLQNIRVNQIPYATSRALNDVADKAVNDLVSWVRTIFNFRGKSTLWIRGKWFRSKWSTKRDLTAYVLGMMDYLLLHEVGGTKFPHRGPHLAVPLGALRFKVIPQNLRPRFVLGNDLGAALRTASLKTPSIRKRRFSTFGQGFILNLGVHRFIAMRTTQDIGIPATAARLKGIRLLYNLVPSVKIVKRLQMRQHVGMTVAREFNTAFRARLAEAMRGAR